MLHSSFLASQGGNVVGTLTGKIVFYYEVLEEMSRVEVSVFLKFQVQGFGKWHSIPGEDLPLALDVTGNLLLVREYLLISRHSSGLKLERSCCLKFCMSVLQGFGIFGNGLKSSPFSSD